MNSIFNRVSVRSFKNDKVEEEKIQKVLRAAMQAPSAGNQQPWEFIIVENKDTLSKLSEMSPYSKCIKDAPIAIVILGNINRMRFAENWMQDLGAATENMLLEITELELGSVWITAAPLEDRMEYVGDLFNLPANIKPYCVLPIGYPKIDIKQKDRYDVSRIHREVYK